MLLLSTLIWFSGLAVIAVSPGVVWSGYRAVKAFGPAYWRQDLEICRLRGDAVLFLLLWSSTLAGAILAILMTGWLILTALPGSGADAIGQELTFAFHLVHVQHTVSSIILHPLIYALLQENGAVMSRLRRIYLRDRALWLVSLGAWGVRDADT